MLKLLDLSITLAEGCFIKKLTAERKKGKCSVQSRGDKALNLRSLCALCSVVYILATERTEDTEKKERENVLSKYVV